MVTSAASQCVASALVKTSGEITGKTFPASIVFDTMVKMHLGNRETYNDSLHYVDDITQIYYSIIHWRESDRKQKALNKLADSKKSVTKSDTKTKVSESVTNKFTKAMASAHGSSMELTLDDSDSDDDGVAQPLPITRSKTSTSSRRNKKTNVDKYS